MFSLDNLLLDFMLRPFTMAFGGSKVKEYRPPAYSGPRPFQAGDVGYGSDQMKGLASAYLPALMARARGESGVGFDPQHRNLLRSEFLKDFGDYESDITSKAQGKASGQGLRGGIPMSIQAENTKSLARARESGLADIDIRDMEARREDINNAFYQQPEEVSRGAGIQQNAANFGLQEYNATKPEPYMEEGPWGDILGTAGTLAGAYFGGPIGAYAGGQLGKTVGGGGQANMSLSKKKLGYDDSSLSNAYSDFLAARRRY